MNREQKRESVRICELSFSCLRLRPPSPLAPGLSHRRPGGGGTARSLQGALQALYLGPPPGAGPAGPARPPGPGSGPGGPGQIVGPRGPLSEAPLTRGAFARPLVAQGGSMGERRAAKRRARGTHGVRLRGSGTWYGRSVDPLDRGGLHGGGPGLNPAKALPGPVGVEKTTHPRRPWTRGSIQRRGASRT